MNSSQKPWVIGKDDKFVNIIYLKPWALGTTNKLIIVANLKPWARQTNDDDTQTLNNRKRRWTLGCSKP